MWQTHRHRVLIVGGGFAGLNCARSLKRSDCEVMLLDRRNFHLFQPLLYQVATGGLSPANIAAPLRSILRGQSNTQVHLANAIGFDLNQNKVLLADGEVEFDTLVVAAGTTHSYFGHDDWAKWAPGLKTVEEALEIRHRIYRAFEEAERATDLASARMLTTFVVVGAGPTGVELAGTLKEIADHTLAEDFQSIDPGKTEVILLDLAERVLPSYSTDLSGKALGMLEKIGVHVRTGVRVTEIARDAVTIEEDGQPRTIAARNVLWAAGVRASSLAAKLAEAARVDPDAMGRIEVDGQLTIPNYPNVFVLGDMARAHAPDGGPLPGIAPVAIQQGKFAAHAIHARLENKSSTAFRYIDRGTMATIGRASAVAKIGRFEYGGFAAWITWLLVHLMFLVAFQNRALVFMQWAWHYFTWNRAARLITGEPTTQTKEMDR
jgi:NADH dehydrogenase